MSVVAGTHEGWFGTRPFRHASEGSRNAVERVEARGTPTRACMSESTFVGVGRERILDEIADRRDGQLGLVRAGASMRGDESLRLVTGEPSRIAGMVRKRRASRARCSARWPKTGREHREFAGSKSFRRVSGKLRAFGVEWVCKEQVCAWREVVSK